MSIYRRVMLPFSVTDMLHDTLREDRRPPDGKLHPSGDLIGSLRHAQLRAAGAPTIASEIVSDVRLMTGTMWHSYFETMFRARRLPVMAEVKLDRWLPEGWSGTADWLVWSDEYKAFVLGDLKTIKGEGIRWVEKDGIKDEHMWQLSSYWHAVARMGIPLVRGFAVFYLPQNVPAEDRDVGPIVCEGMPLPEELVLGVMTDRWEATKQYLDEVENTLMDAKAFTPKLPHFLNGYLAPVQDRIQKVVWNKTGSRNGGVFDLKLAPHWSTAYCPFPDELCDCSTQGVTKVGHYTLDGEYVPRKGYEQIDPAERPTDKDIEKRRKEADANA